MLPKRGPQIENVTQIIIRGRRKIELNGGRPNGVKYERQAVTREYKKRYQKATKKEKRTLPGEFMRLTGYHRKPAERLLSVKPVRELTACGDSGAVKLKPEKKRPRTRAVHRMGKRVYTDEVTAALRLVWTFFWYKRGRKRRFRRYRPR
jgi:hypothetical protein